MIETACGYYTTGADAVRWLLRAPVRCACGTMHYFVINRNGKTRCVECDYKAQRYA